MSQEIPEWAKSIFDEIKKRLEVIEDKIDAIAKAKTPTPVRVEFESLPWKPHKKGIGEWIFANTNGAQELVKKLKAAKGKTIFDKTYRYTLSDDERFLRRFPKAAKTKDLTTFVRPEK